MMGRRADAVIERLSCLSIAQIKVSSKGNVCSLVIEKETHTLDEPTE